MTLNDRFRAALPTVDYASLRLVDQRVEGLSIRNRVPEPPILAQDRGAMITVVHQGGLGYAATPDLSLSGLREAFGRARRWAEATAPLALFDFGAVDLPHTTGRYSSPVGEPWDALSPAAKQHKLHTLAHTVAEHPRLVQAKMSLWWRHTDSLLLTSGGGELHQTIDRVLPELSFVAHHQGVTQSRSTSMMGLSRQGGAEVLTQTELTGRAVTLAEQALRLVEAKPCPQGPTTLVLAPDQMLLQLHESIGHPLELDRILGDERNYAGTSFVRPEMFGTYRYGSPLLNVTFDPTIPYQLASYRADDEGAPATRQHLIRDGVLQRGLGGLTSQARSGLPGVACARACSWNRPPIDRMANLNIEPGALSMEALIGGVARGIYMETNRSWSIDDARNKFQFGCELGREIIDGQLGELVRDPNYRGVSASFWRSLSGVGDAHTFEVLGTPFCGKGEPNQVIEVGHATPACRFDNVDVFGGVQ